MNNEYPIKIKSKREVHFGISLKKDKIYDARECGLGWFALIDEEGEEYAYPPELFDVVAAENTEKIEKKFTRIPRQTVKSRRIM